ncbi:hypothetical protein LAZ67_4002874, partial [Cordylochernes scorpioides]
MTYLARVKKCDLSKLAYELGEVVPPESRIVDLKRLILNSQSYEEEFAKQLLETLIEEREQTEREQTERAERERMEQTERAERERMEQIARTEREQAERIERERKEQMVMEFELEKLRIQTMHGNNDPSRGTSNNAHCEIRKLMPKYELKDSDLSFYLILLERQAKRLGLDEAQWAFSLLGLLLYEMTQLIAREREGQSGDYRFMKRLLLKRYKLSPEQFRQKFEKHDKSQKGSWRDFAFELRGFFNEWIKGMNVENFDALKQGSPNYGPRATSGPQTDFVRPAETYLKTPFREQIFFIANKMFVISWIKKHRMVMSKDMYNLCLLPSWPSELTGVISMALRLESLETPALKDLSVTNQLKKKVPNVLRNNLIDDWTKINNPDVLADKLDKYENVRAEMGPPHWNSKYTIPPSFQQKSARFPNRSEVKETEQGTNVSSREAARNEISEKYPNTYDFNIRHKTGEKMAHVDGISRAPVDDPRDTMEEIVEKNLEVCFTITLEEQIMMIQHSDPELRDLIQIFRKDPCDRKVGEQNRINDYSYKGGRLFCMVKNGEEERALYVIPKSMRKSLVVKFHDLMGHFAVDRTVNKIKELYWFPSMKRYVRRHVARCVECSFNKVPGGKQQGFLHPIKPGKRPFSIVHMDHVGPFVRSTRGNQELLVIVDNLTRFVRLNPLRNTSTQNVLKVMKSFVNDFELPDKMISDRGSCFTSRQFEEFCRGNGIHHTLNSTKHPQGNGMVERVNRTVLSTIATGIEDPRRKDWDLKIKETYYDKKKCRTIQFEVGEIVVMRHVPKMAGEPTKAQPKYRGPLIITEVLPSDTYRVTQLSEITGGRFYTTTAHISQLKSWHSEEDDSATEESPDEESEEEDTLRRNPRRSCNARFNRGRLKSRKGRIHIHVKCNSTCVRSVVMKINREFENRAAIIVALRAGRSPKEIVDFLKLPKTTIYRVKKQFDEADSNKEGIATRKKHSRRSDWVRGEEFVKNVKEKIDGNPGKSMRAIAKEMDVGSLTIVRTIHEDLGLKSYALRKGQLLTENMKNNRKGKAAALLNNLKHDSFGMLRFFSDEKNFDVDQKVNPRNDRWICKDPSEIPVVMHTKFPASVMVLGVISSEGDVMPPHFFEKGLRMNADTYINVLETVVKPWMDMVAAGRKYVFQQDSAPAHKAKKTQSWLTLNAPSHWGPDIWPPNSPDCNPLDYYVWGVVERDVNKAPHTTIHLPLLYLSPRHILAETLGNVTELRRSRRLQGREPINELLPQRIKMEDDHRPTVSGSYLPCQRQRDPSIFSVDGNINPGQWLKEYERVSKYNRWDDTMKLANVVFYLNGTAGRWFDNKEESLNSWRSFEDAFRGVFGLQEDSVRRAEEVLKSRAQKAEESSESYIQEILSLCHQVNPRMEEGEIVAHIIKGISEDTYQVLVAKDIQTVDEILKFCRHLTTVKQRRIGRTKFARLSNVMPISCVDDSDDLAGLIRRIVREEIQKVLSPPEVVNPLREVNALEQTVREEVSRVLQPTRAQINVVQQQPRTPYNIDRPTQPRKTEHWRTYDDKPICFHCGRPGHVVRYCRERRQVFAEARSRNGGEGRNVGFSSGAASTGGEVAIEENPPGYIAAKLKENFVMVEINGRKIKALVDSGADFSVISDKFRRELKTPLFKEPGPILKAANKNLIETLGKCVLNIEVNGLNISFEFVVMVECSHDIIFGWDFFKTTEAVIDCGRNELHLGETSVLESREEENQRLFASDDFVIPSKSIKKISVINEEICGVRDVLVSTSKDLLLRKEVLVPNSLVTFRHGRGSIWVANGASWPQLIPSGMNMCTMESYDNGNICSLIESSDKLQETQLKSREWSQKINLTLDPGLSEIQRLQLVSCLDEFIGIFDFGSTPIKPTSTVKHKINTGDQSPIKQRPYRVAPSERRLIQDEVNKMIENHIVKPSESPWSSPVILVRKKDGTWRFCVDYRRLNKITKKDVYPLPSIDDALDSLAGSSYFSTMDLQSGYWQIEVDEKDREKTAFITPDGLYEFQVMPFGLCNAPATFERMIDSVLGSLKWNMCLCYLDDIVVYAPTFEEHLRRLQLVLSCIQKAGLSLNHKKCHFGSRRIKILGHLVDANGIHPDPDKVEAVSKFPRPRNISELRSFLGLCSYYRRFIENFDDKARSLHDLLKTEKQFYWDAAQEKAFEVLKIALISEPVLGHFDESAYTHVQTDASGHGIGAVILQIQDEISDDYVGELVTRAEEARQLSRSRLLQSQAKDRRLYDQKHTPVYYQKDDLVWVFTPIRK